MTYDVLASVYDELMKDVAYEKWIHFTKDIFSKREIDVVRIADLGCGTGEITVRLAEEGFQLIGVDVSTAMLTYAAQKSSKKNIPIEWINQDIRRLQGIRELDAVVSYCDVINYVTNLDDMRTVFSNVAKSLRNNGVFIFDVHSLQYVEKQMVNRTFTDVTENIAYIWDCLEGDFEGEMFHDITFFVSDRYGKYNRFEEFHHQRTYELSIYEMLLQKSGFINIHFYGDFSFENENLVEKSDRILIVATKKPR